MSFNPVMMATGALMFGASVWEAARGSARMAAVYAMYGACNCILATMKG